MRLCFEGIFCHLSQWRDADKFCAVGRSPVTAVIALASDLLARQHRTGLGPCWFCFWQLKPRLACRISSAIGFSGLGGCLVALPWPPPSGICGVHGSQYTGQIATSVFRPAWCPNHVPLLRQRGGALHQPPLGLYVAAPAAGRGSHPTPAHSNLYVANLPHDCTEEQVCWMKSRQGPMKLRL